MRKLGHFFLTVYYRKQKQLKRSKNKKSKESKFVMLDSPCKLLFYVFKCREN